MRAGFVYTLLAKLLVFILLVASTILVTNFVNTKGLFSTTDTVVLPCSPIVIDANSPVVASKTLGLVMDGNSITNTKVLRNTLVQLIKLGWFDSVHIPEITTFGVNTQELWYWASKNMHSKYVSIQRKNSWSFNWDEDNIPTVSKNLVNTINVYIGLGNISGEVLTCSSLTSSMVILNARNPKEAGYTQGNRFSNRSNVYVAMNNDVSDKQIRMFYNVIGFKRLGILYRDTAAGRADVGLHSIYKLAAEYGFDVIPYILPTAKDSLREKELLTGVQYLSKRTDAIFIPELPGLNYNTIKTINTPILAQDIPTFSQQGKDLVHRGLLTTYSYQNYSSLGQLYATVIGSALNGVPVSSISQYFGVDMNVFVNKEVAMEIKYKVPTAVQRAATAVYTNILNESK